MGVFEEKEKIYACKEGSVYWEVSRLEEHRRHSWRDRKPECRLERISRIKREVYMISDGRLCLDVQTPMGSDGVRWDLARSGEVSV